jgi:hypothetical protein
VMIVELSGLPRPENRFGHGHFLVLCSISVGYTLHPTID